MQALKVGQLVKFHTPFEDEDPNQIYKVIEFFDDPDFPRVDILALNTGLTFPPVDRVAVEDVVAIDEN